MEKVNEKIPVTIYLLNNSRTVYIIRIFTNEKADAGRRS